MTAHIDDAHSQCAQFSPMARPVYDETAPKRAANVSVNADLLEKAKALGINLSQALEGRLIELVTTRVRERWLEENADAIDDYNARIEERGVFGDDLRRF